ncbi:MAG TPA: hypothetical protein VMG62_02620 [Solirubrobacteraceae bacterium]|nr:hypothetical protein [Solirubrobacteraceae bacterium]
MPSSSEIRAQVARESERRNRLAVPAFAGGFLYFISAIMVTATLSSAPTVGLVQGLTPALHGEANPAVSPRANEVKYISQHAFSLVAASAVKAISLVALTLVLLLLLDATRFRRPETWGAARPLVMIGGFGLALVTLVHQIVSTVRAHQFATGHDLSSHAVERALTQGAVNVGSQYLDLLAALALMAGIIAVCVNAMRVGLLTRWMGIVGIFSGVLIFLPIGGATLEIVPAFWMLAMGILYFGRWPNGEPPAWAAGEARPWPTAAERRAEQQAQSDGYRESGVKPAEAASSSEPGEPTADTPAAVEPAPVPGGSPGRRRRKRK